MAQIPTVTLNNGVTMPQLGLGVFRMDPDETAANVSAALSAGYRLIDTAAIYGNEEGVGEAIERSTIPRDEIFVTTKLWNSDQGYDSALAAFDASLAKLKLDYVDLYLIHWPTPARGLAKDSWRALEQLYKSGRVKAIGLSNFTPAHIDELLQSAVITPAVLQMELHPLFTQPSVRQYAADHGIQVESWYPLGGQQHTPELLAHPIITELAERYHKTPAQIVLRWHIELGLVTIPKSSHIARIQENCDIFDFTLQPEEVERISSLDQNTRLGVDPDEFN